MHNLDLILRLTGGLAAALALGYVIPDAVDFLFYSRNALLRE
jgi:hypothetical protein